jgi:hypothetical protein
MLEPTTEQFIDILAGSPLQLRSPHAICRESIDAAAAAHDVVKNP